MKKLLIPILTIIMVMSCQKDDICIDPTTPKLVIRFYDNANPTDYKAATDLSIWAEGLDPLTEYQGQSRDSIALQLDPNADFTTYHIVTDTSEDVITINYTMDEIFVSRSCGFKYNFGSINLTDITNNWIINTEITNQTVEDETEHIKIFH